MSPTSMKHTPASMLSRTRGPKPREHGASANGRQHRARGEEWERRAAQHPAVRYLAPRADRSRTERHLRNFRRDGYLPDASGRLGILGRRFYYHFGCKIICLRVVDYTSAPETEGTR